MVAHCRRVGRTFFEHLEGVADGRGKILSARISKKYH
jgi:hypothetical protein